MDGAGGAGFASRPHGCVGQEAQDRCQVGATTRERIYRSGKRPSKSPGGLFCSSSNLRHRTPLRYYLLGQTMPPPRPSGSGQSPPRRGRGFYSLDRWCEL
jgi:hypothetical protein